jgi:hypothetical protein
MVASPSTTTHPADATLTLACQGTTTSGLEDAKPEPVSMGIIVNFTNRTVQGFGYPGLMDYPVKITAWNDVTVAFGGSAGVNSITGNIDRVTGDVEAITRATNAGSIVTLMNYSLKCRPTQRMF